MDAAEWGKLWAIVIEVQHGFEPGTVFIGGVAIYAHTIDSTLCRNFIAFSHDADMMISVSDYTDLKDIEKVTPNRRLQKAQFYKGGFEFDVYVDGQNGLCVPYEEVAAHSELRSGIRVACLEHLLVLKMKALEDRRGSPKGDKDEDDVLKILMMMNERDVDSDRITRVDDEMMEGVERVLASDAPLRIADGNAHEAANLRKSAVSGTRKIVEARNMSIKNGW